MLYVHLDGRVKERVYIQVRADTKVAKEDMSQESTP